MNNYFWESQKKNLLGESSENTVNEESMKPPQVNEVKPEQEPELGYKVVFRASKFQRS